jgi:hypothetical protein
MKNDGQQMDSREMLFRERYAAARSLKNNWTRLASTYGCMMIVLTRSTLVIKPHWFSKWLIGPLNLDLHHEIPVANIRSVSVTGEGFGRGTVELRFQAMEGKDQQILLYLKRRREFVEKVTGVM